MPDTPRAQLRQSYGAGLLASLPFLIVLIPFALVFGVISVDAGLSFPQIMGFSALVVAGASQITAVQLMADGVPVAIVVVSALAVNLRMAMYSAALTPWIGSASVQARATSAFVLTDQVFALAVTRYEAKPDMTLGERMAFLAGTATMLALPWPLTTALGATVGKAIPEGFALDFAVPITFLAIIAPSLRSRPHAAAAATAFGGGLLFSGLPSGLGLMVAAPIAMAVGAALERRA